MRFLSKNLSRLVLSPDTTIESCRAADRDFFLEDVEEEESTDGADDLLDTLARLDILVDELLVEDVREEDTLSGDGDFVFALAESSKTAEPRRPNGSTQVVVVTQPLVGMVAGVWLHAPAVGIKEALVGAVVVIGTLPFAPE
jgi:hypothetical protein